MPSKKLPKFYLLDSVTKAVGGRYIEMFSRYIRSIFSPAFREAPNSVKKKLLTLLKTWYIYYPHEVLNTIHNELELSRFESELLSPQDLKKINDFIEGAQKETQKKKSMMKSEAKPMPAVQPPMS